MTEDDTFKALKKLTYKELDELWVEWVKKDTIVEIYDDIMQEWNDILDRAGWTSKEWMWEAARHNRQ